MIRLLIISLLFLKIFFIGFWAVANIVTVYDPSQLQLQLTMKTVLIAINTPTNLLIGYLILYFFRMGLRFLVYIEVSDDDESEFD